MMREDRQLLTLTHFSQLLGLVTGLGGILAPLIIWLIKKDDVYQLDEQGKAILNFQISLFIYAIICVPLILLIGLGLLGLILIAIIGFIFPILNGIKVSNGEEPNYPMSIQFLK